MSPEATPLELDAVLISRLLNPGDRVMVGANLPALRAGAILAGMRHATRIALCQGLGWIDSDDLPTSGAVHPGMDVRNAAGASALMRDHEAYDDVARLSSLFVIGGLEIDASGASNLLGIHRDGRWIRRGPGAIGTTSMSVFAGRTALYATRHAPSVFVERCCVRSTPGWGGPEQGPECCISPAGVFDFPSPDRRMRLRHTRPGWSASDVQAATGFALAGLQDATPVEQPDEADLELLRTRIDPEGRLR